MGTSSCGFHLKGGLLPFGHLHRGYYVQEQTKFSMDQWINCKGSDCTLIKGFWISYGMSRFRTTTGVEHCTGLVWCQVFWLDVRTWDLVGPQIRRCPLRIGIVFHQWVWSFGSICDGESTMPIRDQTQDAFLPSHSLWHQTTARQQVQRNIEPGDFWLSTGRRPNRSLV